MEILIRFRITKKSGKHLIIDMVFSAQFVDNHISLLKPNYHFKKIKMNIVKKMQAACIQVYKLFSLDDHSFQRYF